MKTIDIEKLNQLVSRTDISGNDKVKWLINFIDGKELHQQERMYSEEDVKNAFLEGWELRSGKLTFLKAKNKWFNEFKKNS